MVPRSDLMYLLEPYYLRNAHLFTANELFQLTSFLLLRNLATEQFAYEMIFKCAMNTKEASAASLMSLIHALAP